MSVIDAKIPAGPLKDKWSAHKAHIGVVSPANKKKLDVIIVGTGLAGGSAAARRRTSGSRPFPWSSRTRRWCSPRRSGFADTACPGCPPAPCRRRQRWRRGRPPCQCS